MINKMCSKSFFFFLIKIIDRPRQGEKFNRWRSDDFQ